MFFSLPPEGAHLARNGDHMRRSRAIRWDPTILGAPKAQYG